MATIIDGSTYAGYWKITPDDSDPTVFRLSPKSENIELVGTDANNGNLYLNVDRNSPVALVYATTEDEFGNALNTAEKIAEYLSNLR